MTQWMLLVHGPAIKGRRGEDDYDDQKQPYFELMNLNPTFEKLLFSSRAKSARDNKVYSLLHLQKIQLMMIFMEVLWLKILL